MRARNVFLRLLRLLLVVLILAVGGFVLWASLAAQAMPEAIQALESDSSVHVSTEPWLVFEPQGSSPQVGLVFYPGGRVDPRAYAPAMHAFASQGVLAVIVPMPLNLAVFDPGAAADVIAANPGIQHWAVGGHSLGGSMAANFARRNPDLVEGLLLWASYPAGSDDLSGSGLAVTSIYATKDGLTSLADIQSSAALLPPDTIWVALEGGNHAQFGWYGEQSGDQPASISHAQQQDRVIAASLDLLCGLGECAR